MLRVRGLDEEGSCVIYVEGPGEISDSFNPCFDAPVYMAFSDGTVLRLEFQDASDGKLPDECGWGITIEREGSAVWQVGPNPEGPGDIASTRERIFWCVAGDIMLCED